MQTQVQVLTLFAMEVPTSMGRVAFIRACLGEHWTLFIRILQFVFSKWTQTPLISTQLWHSTWIGGATFYALGSVRWNCINRRLQSFSLWKKSTFLQFEEVIHMLNADKYIFAFKGVQIYIWSKGWSECIIKFGAMWYVINLVRIHKLQHWTVSIIKLVTFMHLT